MKIKPHHLPFALSAPIIFVLLLNQSGVSTSTVNSVALSSSHTKFAEVGETLDFSIDVQSLIPMNAIGVSLSYPRDLISITDINEEKSVVDLWVEKPTYSNDTGVMKLSGGLTGVLGFVGRGHVATVHFEAHHPGKAAVTITDAVLLARDGKGTNILEAKENIVFVVREKGDPSPDLNNDGAITFADVTILYFASLRPFQEKFDFTKDGKVSFSDVLYLGSLTRQ